MNPQYFLWVNRQPLVMWKRGSDGAVEGHFHCYVRDALRAHHQLTREAEGSTSPLRADSALGVTTAR